MKNCFKAFLLVFAMMFSPLSASAQTCKSLFLTSPKSEQAWINLIEQIGLQEGTIRLDLSSPSTQASPAFGKLMKTFAKLTVNSDKLTTKNLAETAEKIAKQLYDVANDSEDMNTNALGVYDAKWVTRSLHADIFYQMMTEDVKMALVDFTHHPKPTPPLLEPTLLKVQSVRAFFKKNATKLRIGFWSSLWAAGIYAGDPFPTYVPKLNQLKISSELISKIRSNLKNGNFNDALLIVEADIAKQYQNPQLRRKAYGLLYESYNTFTKLVIAHMILSSAVVHHFAPNFSDTYQAVSDPVIEYAEKEVVTPVEDMIQRLYTHREAFEKLVIAKAVAMKAEMLGHPVLPGSPEYEESVEHVHQMDLSTLEEFYNSMK